MAIAVVCDFDGTITTGAFSNELLDTFCRTDWRKIELDHRKKDITLRQLIAREVAGLQMRPEDLGPFAKKTVKFRPGFWEFYGKAIDSGFRFIVVSEGLKEYIRPFFNPEIVVFANECRSEGEFLKLSTPHESSTCDKCGNCKRNVVGALKERGDFVIYIGDGESDYCAAPFADFRFARGLLARHLAQEQMEFVLFEDFYDVLDVIERMGHDPNR